MANQYEVLSDPGLDGINVGDVLSNEAGEPYQNLNNLHVYVAADLVENTPDCFQPIE